MARKYEVISKLAETTAKEIVKNEETWKDYLNTAARIYKYPFQEQLLILERRNFSSRIYCSSSFR